MSKTAFRTLKILFIDQAWLVTMDIAIWFYDFWQATSFHWNFTFYSDVILFQQLSCYSEYWIWKNGILVLNLFVCLSFLFRKSPFLFISYGEAYLYTERWFNSISIQFVSIWMKNIVLIISVSLWVSFETWRYSVSNFPLDLKLFVVSQRDL